MPNSKTEGSMPPDVPFMASKPHCLKAFRASEKELSFGCPAPLNYLSFSAGPPKNSPDHIIPKIMLLSYSQDGHPFIWSLEKY